MKLRLTSESFGLVSLSTCRIDVPLHARGWAFQEFLLSRRKLIYGKFEILWKCVAHGPVSIHRTNNSQDQSFRDVPLHVYGPLSNSRIDIREHQREIWEEMIADYANREVSKPIDRINALEGIARELQTIWEHVYMMGLWSRWFVTHLAWTRPIDRESDPDKVPELVPTWSWLSLGLRPIFSPAMNREDAVLVSVSGGGLTPILSVADLQNKSTSITLRAKAVRGTALTQPTSDIDILLNLDNGESPYEELTSSMADAYLNDFTVALLGGARDKEGHDRALCLVLKSTLENNFERVGTLTTDGFDWANQSHVYTDLVIV